VKRIPSMILYCILLLASGCATQSSPPVTEYALSPHALPGQAQKTKLPLTIRVSPVEASRIYQVPDLYYVEAGYQRNPYAYNRWVDAPVRMLQLVLQDRLEQSGLFKAVLPSSSSLAADLRLEITLYDFSQHLGQDNSSEGVVRLQAYLIDTRKGRLLGEQQFVSRVPATSNSAEGGVAAINAAVSDILPQLIDWLATTARSDE